MRTHFTTWGHRCRTVLLGAAVGLIACSVAAAQDRDRPRYKDNPDAASAVQPLAAALADAPNARMVALVQAGGTLIMQKGVQSVTRIAAGVYCIKPEAATGIDPLTATAVVSLEYYYSLFNEVQVQWARRGHSCGNGRFGVYTLGDWNLDGVYTFADAAGFVIYVP